jgi:membrane protease YdiL (CAAX protease family)
MKLHWPPRALGLGPPLNLVVRSREHRAGVGRLALQSVALSVAAALLIAAIDHFLFDGATARGTPALDEHPTPAARVLITFVGGLGEELYFRVFFATMVASVTWLVLRRLVGERAGAVTAAQWTGTLTAMIYVGVWHTWMVADPSSDARVMAINSVGNLLYGWTYWRRGLEYAVLTHGVLNATLYLGFPLLH